MSNFRMFRSVVLATAATAVASTAGCGTGGSTAVTAPPGALALVVGAHANAVAPTPVPQVGALLDQAADAQWHAAVILSSGTPKIMAQGPLSVTAKNPTAEKQQKTQNANRLAAAVRNAQAESEEVDLLGALDLAGRSVTSAGGTKTVVVIDSGLQTVAPLRFQERGMLAADPQETADFLEKSRALPRLDGVRLIFSGLGDTAAPQEPLTTADRSNLVDVWRAIGERSGARVEVLDAPLGTTARPQLPRVTPVPPSEPALVAAAASSATAKNAQRTEIELREEAVRFVPNSAAFKDAAAVSELLAPVAARIRDEGLRVHLTGATASAGTPDGRKKLSLMRAEAVKTVLVGLGAPTGALTTAGVGTDWARHVPDLDAKGVLLPGPAAQNRMVLIELSR